MHLHPGSEGRVTVVDLTPRDESPRFWGYCRTCGHTLFLEDIYCPSCGHQRDWGEWVK
jgi:uncharacterized OB-fold protein